MTRAHAFRAAGLFAAGLALGCVAEAKVHNLRELHEEDGRLRYTADLVSNFESVLTLGGTNVELAGIWGQGASQGSAEDVADPAAEGLANLIELEAFGDSDPVIAGWQVEMAAWLAAGEASLLERERAVRVLGAAGARLGGFEPGPAPADPVAPEVVAAAAEMLGRSAGLLRGDAPAPPLDDALAELAGLLGRCDRAGARRVVRATTNAVAGLGGARAPAALAELHAAAQRRAAALALGEALADREAFVRCAALEAQASAAPAGSAALADGLWAALADRDVEFRAAAARVIAERGLPRANGASAAPADADAWLERLIACAGADDGSLSLAAARALARVSGERGPGLRSWEWLAWWEARGAGARTEGDARSPSAVAGS